MSGEPRLQLSGVHKSFGAKIVLAGLDLEIGRGESLVVIGGSGTGKSVMLKCVLGLLRPESGSIRIDGREVIGLSGRGREQVLKKIGMLFQSAALFDSMPVWQNVAFGLVQGAGMARARARAIAIEKLALVGLDAAAGDLMPAALSGGMRKRVGLARAIASEPDLIFFDEPTTGLDPLMGDTINELIVDCVRQSGASTLTITHDMSSARTIADRVAMLHGGRIIWSGPVDAIDNCNNPYVTQFIQGHEEGPIQVALN